jgi:hypothetical protein
LPTTIHLGSYLSQSSEGTYVSNPI